MTQGGAVFGIVSLDDAIYYRFPFFSAPSVSPWLSLF
jgi:hypothetical protein